MLLLWTILSLSASAQICPAPPLARDMVRSFETRILQFQNRSRGLDRLARLVENHPSLSANDEVSETPAGFRSRADIARQWQSMLTNELRFLKRCPQRARPLDDRQLEHLARTCTEAFPIPTSSNSSSYSHRSVFRSLRHARTAAMTLQQAAELQMDQTGLAQACNPQTRTTIEAPSREHWPAIYAAPDLWEIYRQRRRVSFVRLIESRGLHLDSTSLTALLDAALSPGLECPVSITIPSDSSISLWTTALGFCDLNFTSTPSGLLVESVPSESGINWIQTQWEDRFSGTLPTLLVQYLENLRQCRRDGNCEDPQIVEPFHQHFLTSTVEEAANTAYRSERPRFRSEAFRSLRRYQRDQRRFQPRELRVRIRAEGCTTRGQTIPPGPYHLRAGSSTIVLDDLPQNHDQAWVAYLEHRALTDADPTQGLFAARCARFHRQVSPSP